MNIDVSHDIMSGPTKNKLCKEILQQTFIVYKLHFQKKLWRKAMRYQMIAFYDKLTSDDKSCQVLEVLFGFVA